jgi:Kazal-type serine protease inhibitor domain
MKNSVFIYFTCFFFACLMAACAQKAANVNNGQDRPIPPQTTGPMPDKPMNMPPPDYKEPPPPNLNVSKDCQDPLKATDEECKRLYEPVCGCNNVTYSNSCFARREGVLKYTKGACK